MSRAMDTLRRAGLSLILFLSLFAVVLASQDSSNVGEPIVIPASQYWDGKDGPWSTFRISVGTPAQQVRILPASDQSSTWLILPEACQSNAGDDCASDRGELYYRTNSSTWAEIGSYELSTYLEERVGLTGDGLYGNETITLGWPGDGLPQLNAQTVGGIITTDFYVGSLALNPRPMNFTDYNDPIPSLLTNIKGLSTPIPSSSWSYTAGANNLSPKVFGSLILGGKDTTRYQSNDVVFPFGSDISLDFQVAIQSVTSNMTDNALLSTGIISYIDTLVAEVWLPTSACKLFEEAFGLVWNNEMQLYLLNDTLHSSLLEKNPVITFKVGPQVSGASVTIDLPYWNWYQTATQDYVGNLSGLYFPLKRAANDSQYILGRTFLQSTYMSVDYETSTFNLSQALYPASSTSANVISILSPSNETKSSGAGSHNSGKKSGLSTGAIAGIAVGIGLVAVIAVVGAAFWFYRRKTAPKEAETCELEDTDPRPPVEVHADVLKYETGEGLRHEVGGDSHHKIELYAGDEQQKPVEAGMMDFRIHEMPAEDMKYPEMDGEGLTKVEGSSRRPTDASEMVDVKDDDKSPLTLSPTTPTSAGNNSRDG